MSQTWRLTPSPVTLGEAALGEANLSQGTTELLKNEVDFQLEVYPNNLLASFCLKVTV